MKYSTYTDDVNTPIVVYVKYHDRSKVALVCGGGSGHEPSHAGYVGTLDALNIIVRL